jgi:hypothetical protein
LCHAHITGRNAGHFAVGAGKELGAGKTRKDFDPEPFRSLAEPTANLTQRDDEIAVVVHQRRHECVGKPQRAGRSKPIEAILRDRRRDGCVLLAPARQQPIETDRVDNRTGKDVRPDLGALLDHDHRDLGIELLQADRGSEPGRPGAHDHHVEIHRLPGRQFASHLDSLLSPRE